MELNLNTVKRPTLDLTMMDDEQTVLRVKMPTQEMFKELQTNAGLLDAAAEGDRDSTDYLFDQLARLLSNNRDHITVTATDLKKGKDSKYHMDLEDAILVYRAYFNFISSIVNAKN